MSLETFLKEPLQGKTSLSKVFWLYGIVGSLVYGALEFFLDPGNETVMRLYALGGFILSVYVTVATYQCAVNCQSPFLAKVIRVSAVITLLLLPVFTYLELTGALTMGLVGGETMPE